MLIVIRIILKTIIPSPDDNAGEERRSEIKKR